jgi:hypothetical protein
VVEWTNEFRVFVSNGVANVVACPDSSYMPSTDSEKFIKELLRVIPNQTLVIDCGTLAGSGFAVVEVNEGFSFGGYGLDPSIHLDVLLSRWSEMFSEDGLINI